MVRQFVRFSREKKSHLNEMIVHIFVDFGFTVAERGKFIHSVNFDFDFQHEFRFGHNVCVCVSMMGSMIKFLGWNELNSE